MGFIDIIHIIDLGHVLFVAISDIRCDIDDGYILLMEIFTYMQCRCWSSGQVFCCFFIFISLVEINSLLAIWILVIWRMVTCADVGFGDQ